MHLTSSPHVALGPPGMLLTVSAPMTRVLPQLHAKQGDLGIVGGIRLP